MNVAQGRHLKRTGAVVVLSVIFTIISEYYGAFDALLMLVRDYVPLAAFISGLFFTSLFTIAPSIAAFGELSHEASLVTLAFYGALGAVVGDLILFSFAQSVSSDIASLINRSWRRWLVRTFHHPFLQWAVPVLGAIIIASPLPDELGLALMGLSRARLIFVIPVTFIMNVLGITVIWLAVHAL